MAKTFKIGRDAKTARFIPVPQAERLKATAVVETMKRLSVRARRKKMGTNSQIVGI